MDAPTSKAASAIDPLLMAQIAKGDEEAFGLLYERSSTLLFTLLLRIVGNQSEAADLLQEVYLEAWRKASNYEAARGTPMAWLVTLARSRGIDRLRALNARGRDMTASLDDVPPADLLDMEMNALEASAANERQALVWKAIKELPAVQRQAVELAFYEGLTHVEISERLNVPLGTIKTRIRLAMEKLRGGLQLLWEEDLGLSK